MNHKVNGFLEDVCSVIRCKKVHKEICQELLLHIEEAKEDYIQQGFSEEAATERAVAAMGDPREIGQKLHKQHRPQMGWSILLLTAAVSVFGVLMMLIPQDPYRPSGSLEGFLTFMVLGIGVMLGICFFDYRKLRKYPFLYYLGAVFLIYLCLNFGIMLHGAKRYLPFGWVNLYVPGIAAVLFVISFCGMIESFRNRGWLGMTILMFLGVLSVGFILMLPCMTFAFIVAVAFAVIFLRAVYRNYFSSCGKVHFWFLMGYGIFAVVLVLGIGFVGQPYRMERLFLFANRGASDPLGSGWMYVMVYKALQASQWFGPAAPLPEGDLNWVLPNLTGEFALLNIIANYGWVAGILVVLLVALLIVKLFCITKKMKHPFGKSLALSFCVMLSVQFLTNILMNLGYFPISSVALPFVSCTGSLYLVNSFFIGGILSVWRTNRMVPSEPEQQPPCDSQRRCIVYEDRKLIIDLSAYFLE